MFLSKKSFVIALATMLSITAQAQAVILTDPVEDDGDYTFVTSPSPGARSSGSFGLTSQAGANYVSISQSGTGAAGGSFTQTAGFGAVNTIQPGTYEVTMFVGDGGTFSPNRQGFSTYDLRLETTSGTELPLRMVTTPYVDPGNPTSSDWTTTTVEYFVSNSSPLIGSEFRWAADWSKDSSSLGFFGAFDAVTVQFSELPPVPEPSSLLSLGFGTIFLLQTVRRRKRNTLPRA